MSKSKLISMDDAVAVVQDGGSLGLGGWIFYGQPWPWCAPSSARARKTCT